MTNQPVSIKPKTGLLPAIIKTGIFSGILDISAALLYHLVSGGKNPIGIFKFIASGIF